MPFGQGGVDSPLWTRLMSKTPSNYTLGQGFLFVITTVISSFERVKISLNSLTFNQGGRGSRQCTSSTKWQRFTWVSTFYFQDTFWLSWNKYTIIGERACKLHNWAEIELEPRNTCFEANVDLFSYLKISCVLLYMWRQIYMWKQR